MDTTKEIKFRSFTKPLTVEIKSPFWSAGKIYGWKGAGVGINLNILKSLGEQQPLQVRVSIGKKDSFVGTMSKQKTREIAHKYHSFKKAGTQTTLLVLPLEEFST